MKKILIAACAIALAGFAQAAVVNWQVGAINGPGAKGSGWGTEAIGGEGYTATILVSEALLGDVEKGYSLGTLVQFTEGNVLLGKNEEIADGYGWGTTSDSLKDDTTYYAQVIVSYGDKDGIKSTLTSQIVSFETSALNGSGDPVFALSEELGNVSALPGMQFDEKYGVFSKGGWTAVPEPTSGLLMLVGLAGLALRRKRA